MGFDSMRAFIFEEFITEMNSILQSYMDSLCTGYNRDLTATLNSDLELGEVYGKRSGSCLPKRVHSYHIRRRKKEDGFGFALFLI